MGLFLQLFTEFFKIGLFAIGGGMATIPFLAKLAIATGWFTETDLLNMIAISESTPGPIGVNSATAVGYHIAGFPGALDATLGLITPSVIIIIIVSQFLKKFGDSKYVKAVMYGLRAASAGLIAAAGLMVARVTLLHPEAWKTGTWPGSPNVRSILLAPGAGVPHRKIQKNPPHRLPGRFGRGGRSVRICGIRKKRDCHLRQ